jgi:hypothetical protein
MQPAERRVREGIGNKAKASSKSTLVAIWAKRKAVAETRSKHARLSRQTQRTSEKRERQ